MPGEKTPRPPAPKPDRYAWIALANTTAAIFMAAVDGSIVIIALPAIFRGIHLDPLSPGNISYLLWMIMGYRLVQAVLVVGVGRLGDMVGRVRIYNAGFAVFTLASVLLGHVAGGGGAAAVQPAERGGLGDGQLAGQMGLAQLPHHQANGYPQCRCHFIVIRNGPGSLHNAQLKLIRRALPIRRSSTT